MGEVVQRINLTADKIKEPINAYRINEGRFGFATFREDRADLLTCGLDSCKGLVFADRAKRIGLLAHLAVVNDLEKVVTGLVKEFHGVFSEADAFIIFGSYQLPNIKVGIWGGNFPTIDDLITEVSKHNPKRLYVDDQKDTGIRGITLNLGTGEVKEIDGKNGWTWSEQHDTSINRWIEELTV